MIRKNFGFTLIELIITISILAVLTTISSLVLLNWLDQSRDVSREAWLQNISAALNNTLYNHWTVPAPNTPTKGITSGDTLLLGTWWVFWTWAFNEIGGELTDLPKDPAYDDFYIYNTNFQGNKFQLMAFMEEENRLSFTNRAIARDYEQTYPYVAWEQLGIILSGNNKPLNHERDEIDIQENSDEYQVFFNNENKIEDLNWTWKRKIIENYWNVKCWPDHEETFDDDEIPTRLCNNWVPSELDENEKERKCTNEVNEEIFVQCKWNE